MNKITVRQLGLRRKHQQRENFPSLFSAVAACRHLTTPLFSLQALTKEFLNSTFMKSILLSIANRGKVKF